MSSCQKGGEQKQIENFNTPEPIILTITETRRPHDKYGFPSEEV